MSKEHRKNAEFILMDALHRFYPHYKFQKSTGNYLLNQLLKAGYTSDKITVYVDELKEEMKQAAFVCNTEENWDVYADQVLKDLKKSKKASKRKRK